MKKYDMINKNILKYLRPFLSLFLGLFLTGCWNATKQESKLVIINVLDKHYYDDCHIKGSIHIAFDDLEKKIHDLNKENTYVFYCSNYACTAAPFSANMLKEAGFNNVFVYHGGIVEWYQNKFPYVGPARLSYLQEENVPLGDNEHDDMTINAGNLLKRMENAGF